MCGSMSPLGFLRPECEIIVMSSKSEEERLERISKEYFQNVSLGVELEILRMNATYLTKYLNAPILEMGCGNGIYTDIFIETQLSIHVLDSSEMLLEKLKVKYGDRIVCHRALFETFQPEQSYKTICCAGSLHHVEDPVRILRNIHTWLVEDGLLLITVPNALSLHRRLGKCMGLIEKLDEISSLGAGYGHRRVYTPERLEHDLDEAGFMIKEKKGLFVKPFANDQLEGLDRQTLQGLFNLSLELPYNFGANLFYACTRKK